MSSLISNISSFHCSRVLGSNFYRTLRTLAGATTKEPVMCCILMKCLDVIPCTKKSTDGLYCFKPIFLSICDRGKYWGTSNASITNPHLRGAYKDLTVADIGDLEWDRTGNFYKLNPSKLPGTDRISCAVTTEFKTVCKIFDFAWPETNSLILEDCESEFFKNMTKKTSLLPNHLGLSVYPQIPSWQWRTFIDTYLGEYFHKKVVPLWTNRPFKVVNAERLSFVN